MTFQPGQPRPANAGRKIGSVNKKTREMQELIMKFVRTGLKTSVKAKDWKILKPADRVKYLSATMEFLAPKQSRAIITNPEDQEGNAVPFAIENVQAMTPQQIVEMLNSKLLK